MKQIPIKVKSVKHKKVVHSWDRAANVRKTQKKKYCKKYYKGKYKIDKRGCKKDPRCLYADMGSGGEWCYIFDPFGVGTINETPVKIIISGHSSNPNEAAGSNNKIEVPLNYNIHFYANENETCFVPYDKGYDKGSLKMVVDSMNINKHDIFGPGAKVDNYEIEFDEKQGTGIFEYNNEVFELLSDKNMTLKDIINSLDNIYKGIQIELYAVFCRGSVREDLGPFEPVSSDGDFSDFSDFSGDDSEMSGGGGMKKNRSKTKRKTLKPKKKKMRKTKQKKPIKPKKKKTRKPKKKKKLKTKKKKTRK